DIKAVVAQFLTTYYLGQETNAAQAAALAEYELIGGGWRNSLLFLEKLRAVTPADVQRVSQKYMRNIRFVVLGNPAQIDTSVSTGQAGNEGTLSVGNDSRRVEDPPSLRSVTGNRPSDTILSVNFYGPD